MAFRLLKCVLDLCVEMLEKAENGEDFCKMALNFVMLEWPS